MMFHSWKRIPIACLVALLFFGPFSQRRAYPADWGSLKDGWTCGCETLAVGPIQGLFDSYRDGGPEFSEQLTLLIMDHPEFAHDVICASINRAYIVVSQAARALAVAQLKIARTDPKRADEIGAWIACADRVFQAAYYDAQINGKLVHLLIPYVPDGPGGGVVSPSKP